MKRLGVLLFVILLLGACQEVPEGKYIIIPADGQIITPMTAIYEGYSIELMQEYPTEVQPTPTREWINTPTPTVQPATCQVQATTPVNIRELPGTQYAWVGTNTTGTVVTVTGKYQGSLLWYEIYDGWTAAPYYTTLTDCSGVPDVMPPFPATPILAIHFVPGGNTGELINSFSILNAKGIQYGAKVVSDVSVCQAVYNAGGVCIYRSVLPSDCPNVDNPDAKLEAKLYLLSLSPHINPVIPYAQWVEVTNECRYDQELWQWWNMFIEETVRLAHAWNWPPLVIPTFGPGWPTDLNMLNVLAPSLKGVRDTGGMLGLHAYSIYPDTPLCMYNQWLSYRHRMTHDRLVTLGLGNLNIALTEIARGDGTLVPINSDIICYFESLKEDTYVRFVAFWTLGKTSHWANADLEGHLIPIAQGVN